MMPKSSIERSNAPDLHPKALPRHRDQVGTHPGDHTEPQRTLAISAWVSPTYLERRMRCVRPAHGPRHVQDAVARYPVLFGRHHHTVLNWAVPGRQPHVAVDCHAVERRRDRGLARCMHRNACRRVSAYTQVLRHSDWERDIIIRPWPPEGRLKPGSLFIRLGSVSAKRSLCPCAFRQRRGAPWRGPAR